MSIYLLLIPLLVWPNWKLLGVQALVAIVVMGALGAMAGVPLADALLYGGIELVAFAVAGALLIIIRRAFTKKPTAPES